MQYLTDNDLASERGCILSDCGTYRYRLWREWDSGRPTLAFLMLNPSTADHLTNDQTIMRCMAARAPVISGDWTSSTCSRYGRPIRPNC